MIVEGVEIVALEYRGGDGLIVRSGLLTDKQIATLDAALTDVLRGSPYRLCWFCCDAPPNASHRPECTMHQEEDAGDE